MKNNLSNADKYIRIILGVIIAFLAYFVKDNLICYGGLVIGMYFVATGFLGICLLYSFLGINTKTVKKRKRFY